MAQPYLPSPPTSRPPSPSHKQRNQDLQAQEQAGLETTREDNPNEDDTLSTRLDALLASYLELLDTYTTLRDRLSEDFSSGFFALARANRTSTLGPSRRYGEEGFDERMKALRTVEITMKHNSETETGADARKEDGPSTEDGDEKEKGISLTASVDFPGKDDTSTIAISNREYEEQNQDQATNTNIPLPAHRQTRHASPTPLTHIPSQQSVSTSDINSTTAYRYLISRTAPPDSSTSLPRDPLKWYGILIPPYLRQCQGHFTSSVSSTIPDLVSTIASLDALETDIWSTRRELGILSQYDHPRQDDLSQDRSVTRDNDMDPTKGEQTDIGSIDTSVPSIPIHMKPSGSSDHKDKGKRNSHTSVRRPSEPRPRVLKLD